MLNSNICKICNASFVPEKKKQIICNECLLLMKGGQFNKMDEQKSVGEWDSYISNFLKHTDVTSEDQIFVVISTEEVDNRGEKTIRLHLESKEIKYLFDLNKTNSVFVKNVGIKHPNEVIGKKLCFKIVMARNPQLNKEVESLRIIKVE